MPRLQPLPIDALLPAAIAGLKDSPALVLRSPTGSGKTTRLPPALEAAGLGPVFLLQPRRISARAAAARMAWEAGEKLGQHFGYQVRFDKQTSKHTRVTAVTEGIFLRRLLADPFLEGVGCVVFDEFHERHLEGDLCLALVRRIQQELRPELRIVVLSATLEPARLEAYLEARVMLSEGRLFPVEVRHQPAHGREPLEQQVLRATTQLCEETRGDLLVFLPGKHEIRRAEQALASLAKQADFELHPLHGQLSPAAQDAALARGKRRKVILSTNLAESSVTVEGVTGVIDSGLARIPRFNAQQGIDSLDLVRISMQSVEQRAGRAGRQEAGINLRLWSRLEEGAFSADAEPEIKRVDLAGAWLSLLDFGEQDPKSFHWYEAPEAEASERAAGLLQALGATRVEHPGEAARITPLGRELARLPLHPRLGRLLIAGRELGCLERAALSAALISERDALGQVTERMDPERVVDSDVLECVELLEEHAAGRGLPALQRGAARQVLAVRDQLMRTLKPQAGAPGGGAPGGDQDEALLRALFIAYADRLARRRSKVPGKKQQKRTKKVARVARHQPTQEQRALLTGGRGARLGRDCHVREAALFVCIELAGGGAEAEVRQASMVRKEWLDEAGYREELRCVFDADKDLAKLLRATSWNGLLLHEAQLQDTGPAATQALEAALGEAAGTQLERAFDLEQEDFKQFIARWNFLDECSPALGLGQLEGSAWVRQKLPRLVRGCRSFAELRGIKLAKLIRNDQDYGQTRLLDEQAPARFALPGGRSAAISYAPGQPPVLAARIQHFLGLDEHPSIAGGRVSLLLQLCAPNGRPEQITSDLPGFWRGSYALVRKELRGRYPKQDWPEDPLNFTPKPRGKRGPSQNR